MTFYTFRTPHLRVALLTLPARALACSALVVCAFGSPAQGLCGWQTFTPSLGPAMNNVNVILEDRFETLWFGTLGGLRVHDGISWGVPIGADNTSPLEVYSAIMDRSGALWFATFGTGVLRFDGQTWTTYTVLDGLASNFVQAALADGSGTLWFGTASGLSCYNGSTWKTYTAADGLALDEVTSLFESADGALWVGTGGGASRYDGGTWTTFTTAQGLANGGVFSITQDTSGAMWFGTSDGLTKLDGSTATTFRSVDGLAGDWVSCALTAKDGSLWFGTRGGGVSRYADSRWRSFTTADGLADNYVYSIMEDHSGNLWFGTRRLVSRFDRSQWTTYSATDGLASDYVTTAVEDPAGDLWFGTAASGVSRYDGVNWVTLTSAEGLAHNSIRSITADSRGALWFGTNGAGVSRYDGLSWRTYTTADGLASNYIQSALTSWEIITTSDGLPDDSAISIMEDARGNIWVGTVRGGAAFFGASGAKVFTTYDGLASNDVHRMLEAESGDLWFIGGFGGLSRYEPDYVAPQTKFSSTLLPLSTSPLQAATYQAAFGETGVEFSHRLDENAWSGWSSIGNWVQNSINDGVHVLEVRSKDVFGNIDPTPARVTFEVDATPPVPVISSPAFGQVVRGSVGVLGTAADPRFREYSILVRPAGANSWLPPVACSIAVGTLAVTNDTLANWNTNSLADGLYEVRLAVADTLGLVGTYLVTVIIDNEFPPASVTTPAIVNVETGGDVFTNDAGFHLYFGPRSFTEAGEATVSITSLAPGSVTDSLDSATFVGVAYDIGWEGKVLSTKKHPRAEQTLSVLGPYTGTLAFYRSLDSGQNWEPLGGTVDLHQDKIRIPVDAEGWYALFAESAPSPTPQGWSDKVSFTPRVFSPTGGFADREVGISFSLPRPARTTIRVFNRSGRLIKEVLSAQNLTAGWNMVRWDGRDADGREVLDGLYFVTVEALGKTLKETLAVVR